ncbi:hypothetical protein [Vibrio sp. HN007]|uniref:hypothetical protein n=1 Tax=Vibrio iocasae TaxID=3098914 RepID=UPI0035D458E2
MKRFRKFQGGFILLASLFSGGLFAQDQKDITENIERFTENIYLTQSNTDSGLKAFLERNDGRIVFIDGFLDASLSTEEQTSVEQGCELDVDAIVEQELDNTPVPLPYYDRLEELNCFGSYLVFDLSKETIYAPSFGGTGVVMIRLKGFFDVFTTYHSGPSIHYHLKAIAVPLDVRLRMYGQ